jgi:hypothetical protein
VLVPIDKATGTKKKNLTKAETKDMSERKHAQETQAAARKKK